MSRLQLFALLLGQSTRMGSSYTVPGSPGDTTKEQTWHRLFDEVDTDKNGVISSFGMHIPNSDTLGFRSVLRQMYRQDGGVVEGLGG